MTRQMLSFIFIFTLIMLLSVLAHAQIKAEPTTKITVILQKRGYSAFHVSCWVKVARMESGNYKSPLFKFHNNPWGMSFAYFRRPTTQLYQVWWNNKKTRFAGYRTIDDGIEDMAHYLEHQQYPKNFNTLHEFCVYLKDHHYFEEPLEEYYKELNKI